MPTEITVNASDPAPGSRAFPWPVLEPGNGSYPNGLYTVKCENTEPGKSFQIHHSVENAALIQEWISSEQIFFVCSVAAPRSMYRTIHKSTVPEQLVEWVPDNLGEHPMFTPMMVAKHEISHAIDAETDGLSPIWHGRNLTLPKGARVAIGPTFKFQSGISGLLDFSRDDELSPGEFWIEANLEDGFRFKVHLGSNLYQHLQYQRHELAGTNIMVHIVSSALGILQRDHSQDDGEEGWRSFRNLLGLAELLDDKNLRHWSDKEFKPEQAATRLYPHQLPDGTST